MNYLEIATQVAKEMNVLGPEGRLVVDSFQIVDLAARLEQVCGIRVPDSSLRRKWFQTTETLAELLSQQAK